MAFLPQDEQNQNAPQGQTTNNPQGGGSTPPPQQSGGSVGAASGGTKAGAAPSTGTSQQFGSSASKLGDYLSANAPQIQNQANNIVGGLNNQFGQVNQDITNAANNFQSQVQGGYTAGNQDVVNQAKNDVTGFAKDPNNVKAFQAQYNNQYNGPQNFEGTDQYGNIQNEVNSAVQNANLLQSPAGLQSYLAGTQKNPTRASTTLDQLLLNGNPEAQASIQNAAKQFGGLSDQFGNVTSQADQSVQGAQKAAQDAQAYARGQFDPYVQQFGNDINNQAQTQQNALDQYNTGLGGFRGQLQTLNDYLKSFQASSGKTTGDVLAPYYAMQPLQNNITAQTAATPEQAAQASAFAQLLGQNYGGPQLDSSLAGTATVVPGGTLPTTQGIAQQIANAAKTTYANEGAKKADVNDPLNQLLKNLYQYDQFNPTTKTGINQLGNTGLYNVFGQ